MPVDGDISPDNIRYYYLVRDSTTKYGGVLSVRIADGSVVRFVRFGDLDIIP